MANRFINPTTQYFGNDGLPLEGGKLYFYETGGATPADTYTVAALTPGSENTNPVVLDAAGRHGSIFLDPAITYRVVLKTSADVTVWTADPVVDVAANVSAAISVYPGNPNGNVAGNEGTPGGIGSSMVYDSASDVMYVCTQTGDASTAQWTAQAGGAADLGVANTFTALPQTVQSTDAGTTTGPFFVADWDSASPAANDAAIVLRGMGEDSAGNDQNYVSQSFRILDPTSGSEDAEWVWGVITGGSEAYELVLSGAALFPETNAGLDLGKAAQRFAAAHVNTIELGNASDTTLSRSAAGKLAVEGVNVALNSTSADAHIASSIELGHASDTTLARAAAGMISVEGTTIEPGANRASFRAHKNGSNQAVGSTSETQVTFGTEVYDVGSKFSSSAWTPPAGKVIVGVNALVENVTSGTVAVRIKRDTTVIAEYLSGAATAVDLVSLVTIDDANGSNVYTVHIQTSADSSYSVYGAAVNTYFWGAMA